MSATNDSLPGRRQFIVTSINISLHIRLDSLAEGGRVVGRLSKYSLNIESVKLGINPIADFWSFHPMCPRAHGGTQKMTVGIVAWADDVTLASCETGPLFLFVCCFDYHCKKAIDAFVGGTQEARIEL